jgi:hypothetical protein
LLTEVGLMALCGPSRVSRAIRLSRGTIRRAPETTVAAVSKSE